MSKARDLSKLLSGGGSGGTIAPALVSDQNNTSTGHFDVPAGTTAQRPASPNTGYVRFNTTLDQLEQYTSDSGWQGISAPPTITSTTSSVVEQDDPQTIVVTGQNFDSAATAKLVDSSGTDVNASTVTRNSSSQITLTFTGANTIAGGTGVEPYDVKVINGSGLSAVLEDSVSVNNVPVFTTAANTSVATVYEDTLVPTTINSSNYSNFHIWSDGTYDNYNVSKFFTGGSNDGWADSYDDGTTSWYIDLKTPREIDNITWDIQDGDGSRTAITWSGSNDLSTWTTLWSSSSPGSSNNTTQNQNISDSNEYRYLRYSTTHSSDNWGRTRSLVITLAAYSKDTTFSPVTTATDPEGASVTYTVASSSLPTNITVNTNNTMTVSGDINHNQTYSSSGVQHNFTLTASDGSNSVNRTFAILRKWYDGTTSTQAAESAQAIRSIIGSSMEDGVRYIITPNGGIQQVYCINDGTNGWMLIARYASNAMYTVKDQMNSVRGLTDVSQSGANKFSADFGTYDARYVMLWGASDFENASGTNINWIYGVPTNRRTFRSWLVNGNDKNDTGRTTISKLTVGNGGQKHGQLCAGAWDGPYNGSRWSNTGYIYHRGGDQIDSNNDNSKCHVNLNGLTTPTNDVFYNWGFNGSSTPDAKWSVHASNDASGQDYDSGALFGYDDNNGPAFYDAGTGTVAQNSSRVDTGFNTAVTMWIR